MVRGLYSDPGTYFPGGGGVVRPQVYHVSARDHTFRRPGEHRRPLFTARARGCDTDRPLRLGWRGLGHSLRGHELIFPPQRAVTWRLLASLGGTHSLPVFSILPFIICTPYTLRTRNLFYTDCTLHTLHNTPHTLHNTLHTIL